MLGNQSHVASYANIKNIGFVMVPETARVILFLEHGVLAPMSVVFCKHRLLNEEFKSEAIVVFDKLFNDA